MIRLAVLATTMAIAAASTAHAENHVRFQNYWTQVHLNVEHGHPEVTTVETGWWSAMWVVEPVIGHNFVRIRNRWTNGFVNVDSDPTGSAPQVHGAPSTATSWWKVEPIPGTGLVRIRNASTGKYFTTDADGTFTVAELHTGWWSQMWTIDYMGAPPAGCAVPWWQSSYPPTRTDSTWMADNYEMLCKKQLREIAIPATHDAATFSITSTLLRNTTFTNSDEVFAPDVTSDGIKILSLLPGFVDPWAKAQAKPIRDQLADGIRYFDIRVCVDGFGKLLTCHSLYSAPVDEVLTDVANFVASRPGEIVILGFNHFWDGAWQKQNGKKSGEFEGLRPEKWAELVNLVKTRLQGKLARNSFTPSSRLSDLQEHASAQETNQVIALFDRNSSEYGNYDSPSSIDGFLWVQKEAQTWVGEEWHLDQFKQLTLNILNNAAKPDQYVDQFYAVRASVTPTQFVTLSFDPFATFPRDLLQLADQTNPVVLGWLKNEWTNLPVNLIWADFYNRTELVKLAKFRNGIPVDLAGTTLGRTTNWANWRAPLGESYGRGAPVALVCGPNEEQQGLFCYPKCAAGYLGALTICQKPCPAGWRNDGLTCFRDARIISADISACPGYDYCGLTLARNCSKCPEGYINDGCTCRIDAKAIARERYDRGGGRGVYACPAGYEKDQTGLACYQPCRSGFTGVGTLCVRN